MITLKSFALIFLATLWPVIRASTQTIQSFEPYRQQRPCAGSCFWDNAAPSDFHDILGINLRCCTQYRDCHGAVDDKCYCRADLRPSAVDWLSRCVATRCSSNAVDFTSAVAVYDGYCSEAVGATEAVTTSPPVITRAPSGTNGAGPGGSTIYSPVTIVVTQTAGSSPSILKPRIISIAPVIFSILQMVSS